MELACTISACSAGLHCCELLLPAVCAFARHGLQHSHTTASIRKATVDLMCSGICLALVPDERDNHTNPDDRRSHVDCQRRQNQSACERQLSFLQHCST